MLGLFLFGHGKDGSLGSGGSRDERGGDRINQMRADYTMQLLKALVIGMGVLIVLAIGLLAYGLLSKTKEGNAPSETPSFGDLALAGNAGCRIESTVVAGERLVIELAPATAGTPDIRCEKLIVIDLGTGTVIGGIALQP